MWQNIVIVLVVIVAGLLVYAATRPDSFSVERRVSIKAPPGKIAPLLTDFRAWPRWSPWEKLDPDMKRTLSGAVSGPGAVYEWSGSGKVGAGRMEIKDATPTNVAIKLDFLKPFEAHNMADFSLAPRGAETEVTWRIHGPSPFVSKLMGVFVSMDKMLGKDFETGLANLRVAAEQ